jgi:hypothetical protein
MFRNYLLLTTATLVIGTVAACSTGPSSTSAASSPTAAVSSPAATASAASTSSAADAYQPTDPAGVQACISAWVKLHNEGVTAKVLAEAEAKTSEAAELTLMGNMADAEKGAVCGTLSRVDDTYATAQINARTGDDYKVGSAVK